MNKKRQGFSLVEVIVYIFIITLIFGAVSYLVSTMIITINKDFVVAEVEGQGREISQIISNTIKNASSTYILPPFREDSPSLTIPTDNTDTDPTVFYLSDGYIYRKESNNTDIRLNNDKVIASDLIFKNMSSTSTHSLIQFSFTLTSMNTNRPEYLYSKSFQNSAGLRQ